MRILRLPNTMKEESYRSQSVISCHKHIFLSNRTRKSKFSTFYGSASLALFLEFRF
jgi:hypothetical protein